MALSASCRRTHLNHFERDDALNGLVHSASQQITLHVVHPDSHSSCGYQFLLGLLPLTRVFPDDASEIVTAKLQLHAGRLNHGLDTSTKSSEEKAQLNVEIQTLSVNGYDLILRRLPRASVTLTGNLRLTTGAFRTCKTVGSHSEFTTFAFAPDLNRALEAAIDEAAESLIRCLLE